MNYVSDDIRVWKFPDSIGYESVHHYMAEFTQRSSEGDLVFDLSSTDAMHSSFIGFLIHAKQVLAKNNYSLVVVSSQKSREILNMLNLDDYFFSPVSMAGLNKKSADCCALFL